MRIIKWIWITIGLLFCFQSYVNAQQSIEFTKHETWKEAVEEAKKKKKKLLVFLYDPTNENMVQKYFNQYFKEPALAKLVTEEFVVVPFPDTIAKGTKGYLKSWNEIKNIKLEPILRKNLKNNSDVSFFKHWDHFKYLPLPSFIILDNDEPTLHVFTEANTHGNKLYPYLHISLRPKNQLYTQLQKYYVSTKDYETNKRLYDLMDYGPQYFNIELKYEIMNNAIVYAPFEELNKTGYRHLISEMCELTIGKGFNKLLNNLDSITDSSYKEELHYMLSESIISQKFGVLVVKRMYAEDIDKYFEKKYAQLKYSRSREEFMIDYWIYDKQFKRAYNRIDSFINSGYYINPTKINNWSQNLLLTSTVVPDLEKAALWMEHIINTHQPNYRFLGTYSNLLYKLDNQAAALEVLDMVFEMPMNPATKAHFENQKQKMLEGSKDWIQIIPE